MNRVQWAPRAVIESEAVDDGKYKIRVFFNQTRGHRFIEYHDHDVLKPSVLSTFRLSTDGHDYTDQEYLEAVFTLLNHDERPNGSMEPSLSVADVIVLENDSGHQKAFAVCDIGFKPILVEGI
jgi:hypothetical protein